MRTALDWARFRDAGGVQTSPLLERLKARGYEVLYLRDPVDEWTFQSLADYRGIRFQDVAKEGLKLGTHARAAAPAGGGGGGAAARQARRPRSRT